MTPRRPASDAGFGRQSVASSPHGVLEGSTPRWVLQDGARGAGGVRHDQRDVTGVGKTQRGSVFVERAAEGGVKDENAGAKSCLSGPREVERPRSRARWRVDLYVESLAATDEKASNVGNPGGNAGQRLGHTGAPAVAGRRGKLFRRLVAH